jgi:hypothetical protein
VPEPSPRKTVRSYRLVFRRRWRIFRIQGWRIPLPGGVELRLLAYWLASLAAIGLLGRLPLLGALISTMPASLRLLALPLASAWLLCRWEVDGRPPHRALLGLIGWRLRPRQLAALRRVPAPGAEFAPLAELALAPDLTAPTYPPGLLAGPATILLRYPVRVAVEATRPRLSTSRDSSRNSRRWRLTPLACPPLHSARTLSVPSGCAVSIAPERP